MQLGDKFKLRLMRTFQNSKQNDLLEYYKEMLINWLIQDKSSFTNREKKNCFEVKIKRKHLSNFSSTNIYHISVKACL